MSFIIAYLQVVTASGPGSTYAASTTLRRSHPPVCLTPNIARLVRRRTDGPSGCAYGRRWINGVTQCSIGPVHTEKGKLMNQIIWIVGAIVIVLFILGFLGLR